MQRTDKPTAGYLPKRAAGSWKTQKYAKTINAAARPTRKIQLGFKIRAASGERIRGRM